MKYYLMYGNSVLELSRTRFKSLGYSIKDLGKEISFSELVDLCDNRLEDRLQKNSELKEPYSQFRVVNSRLESMLNVFDTCGISVMKQSKEDINKFDTLISKMQTIAEKDACNQMKKMTSKRESIAFQDDLLTMYLHISMLYEHDSHCFNLMKDTHDKVGSEIKNDAKLSIDAVDKCDNVFTYFKEEVSNFYDDKTK